MLLLRCPNFDLIWIEKEIFPYFPAVFERVLSLLGKPYVVDYDDAVFHNYDLSTNLAIRIFLGKKIDTVMRKSSLVIAGNNYLANRARLAGAAEVVVIPTVIDMTRYRTKTYFADERPVIGWIGSPSTEHYIVSLRDVLADVCGQFGAKLLLIGATEAIVDRLPGCDVEVAPWSEESEVDEICKMDIGIMPLTDEPWERGKCGYKLIQYMGCGVAVIASPVGVNTTIVAGSNCGLLAEKEKDWLAALTEMLESREKLAKYGAAGRQAADKHYSLQVQSPNLARLLKSMALQN
jgi:glycosyltransferase involved in cell wall biosynthesis